MMKTISLLSFLTLACAATLGAQTAETTTTTTTNVRMTGGKSVTLRGCVEADPDGGYLLTHVADKDGQVDSYVLVTTNPFFASHVGQRVEVKGKLGDRKHGHVDVVTDFNADGQKSHFQTDARNNAVGLRYLGPDRMKSIATFCS
jgi:hypothetical protein